MVNTQVFWVSVALALLLILMSSFVPHFASAQNFLATSRNVSYIALVALGMSILIIGGGIDLSVGSVMGLAGICCALWMQSGGSALLGVLVGLAAAASCGLANGLLIARYKLSPFVVTLGMMSVARSLALVVSNNQTLFELGPEQDAFQDIGSGSYWGIPAAMLLLLLLGLLSRFALKSTRWGRYVYALGGSEESALRAGVPVVRTKISLYVLCSLCAGLSGILMVAWLGSVSSALGTGYELQVIAAAVIGGAALSGGEGGIAGAIVGAALVEVIRNSLLLAGVNPYWQGSFVGLFIIAAVALQPKR
jgi:ribose transport system permease protein